MSVVNISCQPVFFLKGRAGVNDQGANQGGGGDTKSDIAEPATDNNSSGENSERRGSNGSLGTAQLSHGQAAEKKPNKKKLQAEQRIREKVGVNCQCFGFSLCFFYLITDFLLFTLLTV